MLSNRADVYNLGEIIGDSREVFELSYIENCLTSNAILQPLARANREDQHAIYNAAKRGTLESLDLKSNLSPDQVNDMLSVLTKLIRVRDIVLRVNRTYIQSAGQADSYRTEPPFKLQGSYRNMNRIAERVVPVMNEKELEELVVANYVQDAQTLTRDSESNLLKFFELLGTLTTEQQQRWEQIKYAFSESVRMQGVDGEDTAAQVLRSLTGLRDGLESIRRTIAQAVASNSSQQNREVLAEGLAQLTSQLSGVGQELSSTVRAAANDIKQQGIEEAQRPQPDQRVIVQHSVPRVMTDLVRSQFQLLYDGLRPVLESSALSTKQLAEVRRSIDECLNQYRALQQEIDKTSEPDLPDQIDAFED